MKIKIWVTLLACLLCANETAVAEPEITLSKLSDLVFDPINKVTSVEDVISKLPQALKTNYVLMQHSQSLQEGTPEHPRVITFGKAADIFIAFNAGLGLNKFGGSTIEAIDYRQDIKKYSFVRFEFDLSKLTPDLIPDRKNQFVAELRGTKNCSGCHGITDPRPNWEPYPQWPGAIPQSFRVENDELAFLNNFVISGASNSRYQLLNRQGNIDAMIAIHLQTSMASQMDTLLQPYRQDRLIRKLSQTPDFNSYQYAILASLSACPNIDQFVPDNIRTKFESENSYSSLSAALSLEITKNAPLHNLFFFSPANSKVVTGLRWLLENRSIDMSFWSTSFSANSHLFTTTSDAFFAQVVLDLGNQLGIAVPQTAVRASLTTPIAQQVLLTPMVALDESNYCADLQKQSLSALTQIR